MRSLPPLATRDRVIGAVLVVGCGIVQAVALAVAAFATRDAFAGLHGGASIGLATVLELACAGLAAATCVFISRRQAEALGQSYATSLRRALYEQIAKLPKSQHEQRRTGALSLRFVGDLSAARLWFGRGLPDCLTALVVLPGAIAILISLDPRLAVAGLVPLGFAIGLMAIVAWHLEQRHRRLRTRRASIAIDMIERIAIAPELDLMGRTEKELRVLDKKGASLKADAVARRGRMAGLQSLLQLGVALSALSILWVASRSGAEPSTVAASLSVLALVALPVQDLGGAWDRLCAWAVAREKAQRLFDEPCLARASKSARQPLSVSLTGTATFVAEAGSVTTINGPDAQRLARMIAGLDQDPGITVSFDGSDLPPKIAYIGDAHIGLQGSLRRTLTLSARKRPDDAKIERVVRAFGLSDLLIAHGGLDQRIAENGKGLSAAESLRLDLARAVLCRAEVTVISSLRWAADSEREGLLDVLRGLSPATVIVAESTTSANSSIISKAV